MDNALQGARPSAAWAKHLLVLLAFSFCGWLWETIYVSLLAGELVDRGFLLSPICPIYGSCLLAIYLLLGTPQQPRGLLRRMAGRPARYGVYLLFAGLVPTAMELAVGVFFHRVFDVRLWTYEANPLNFHGYICLYNSVFWAVAVTALMRFVYQPVQRRIFRLPDRTAVCIAVPLAVWLALDVVISFVLLF